LIFSLFHFVALVFKLGSENIIVMKAFVSYNPYDSGQEEVRKLLTFR